MGLADTLGQLAQTGLQTYSTLKSKPAQTVVVASPVAPSDSIGDFFSKNKVLVIASGGALLLVFVLIVALGGRK